MSADVRLLCEDEVMGLMLNKEADVMEVMTLNEAIQRCEEVAKENREYAEDALDRYNLVPNDITKQEHDRCKQCAAEHRQLAEWLKDYERLKEQEPYEDAISRQAAVEAFQMFRDYYSNRSNKEWVNRIETVLNQLPPVNSLLCEDAVSRQAAIDYCYQLINVEHQQGSDEMNYGQERVNQTETILHHLEFMPSVRPEQKTGHWIRVTDKVGHLVWECDKCDWQQRFNTNYCPNCGCRMVEPQESEE